MGNFFKDVRKLYISLENSQNHIFAKRGKNILSILSHLPMKKAKCINKKLSFVERERKDLLEEAFRIHIRDKRRKYQDLFSYEKKNFFLEIIFSGEEVILRWPTGQRVFSYEEMPEDKILKEVDNLLKKMIIDHYLPPEKEISKQLGYKISYS